MFDDEDYDDEIMYHGKEEPDCFSCSDAGCPGCGHIDPSDPEHQRYVAEQILLARAASGLLGQLDCDDEIDALIGTDMTTEQLRAIRELIYTGVVTTTVSWPDPAGLSDEMPF